MRFVVVDSGVAMTALPGASVDGTEDEECGANGDADGGCVEVKDTHTAGDHDKEAEDEFAWVAAPFGGAGFRQA